MGRSMKILYFEGAGWSDAEISKATIGNCRIRTAFHLNDGRAVYLEIGGTAAPTRQSRPEIYKWPYTGFVDYCHLITDDIPNDDCNKHGLMSFFTIQQEEIIPGYYNEYKKKHVPDRIEIHDTPRTFCYSEEGILEIVNDLGASFDAIKVVPDLGGYRVFPSKKSCFGPAGYYYGDEFQFDAQLTARREAVYRYYYELEKSEGKKYPTLSLWVDEFDPGLLHLLRHFSGTIRTAHNTHWIIHVDTGETLDDWVATAKETHLGKYGC